ncbi:hypothetical protein CRE_23114 [Caenorhabditis remanei]|uniref:Protein kinase domain-containing protein n=1 Tax=Caenorhabditis remanei TaxID=31234 RepID=E3ND31_CAERE|nr:hypothetical protein CRE_23114 [Caenorhabditis remanei]
METKKMNAEQDDLYYYMRKWSRHFRYFRNMEEQREEQKRMQCLEHLKDAGNPENRLHAQFSEHNLVFSEKIGKGAFGEVFIAQCIPNDTKVAVKRMKNSRKELQKYTLLTETRIHMLSNNKNILPLFGYYQTDEYFHLVMPYYVKGSLSSYMDEQGSLDRIECARISFEILNALVYLHSKKIVHRDLKPDNILIGDNEEIRITDFGMADFQNRIEGKCGTLNNMAPEVIKCQQQSYSVDVWSFGCIVFEMLTGHYAFDDEDDGSLEKKICSGSYKMHDKIPIIAALLISECLQKIPSQRPSTKTLFFHTWIVDTTEEAEKKRKIEDINKVLGKNALKSETANQWKRNNKSAMKDSGKGESSDAGRKTTLRNKPKIDYKE